MMSASSTYSNDLKSFHKAIKRGNIHEVETLLSKLPADKHFYDAKNNSAPAVAIQWEKHEIYELLVAKGIFLGPHEWMDKATLGQDRSQKEKLREIHRKYFNDPNLKHLANLITSTKLSHEASSSDRREHLRLITEAFEDLNGLKSIEPILKVASTSPKLRIVFDFNRDSVEFLDPVLNRNVKGICYTEKGIVYVGAKDLKNVGNHYKVLGTLIHELTHFVMNLVYGNEAKPYHHGDQEKTNEFSQVVNKTAAKKESEPYITVVYKYPERHHHAELIVRVPHLTALYRDDEKKTNEMQKKFSELFDFYEENTLVDLRREFPLMEVKHEIRELNELCGTLAILEKSDIEMSSQALYGLDLNSLSTDEILFISSNCPQLTSSAVLQKARTEIDFETSFIFADLRSITNEKIFGSAAKALALFTKPRLIIDCQGVVKFDEVMAIVRMLNDNKINQKVVFVIDKKFEGSCDAKLFKVVHSWMDLTSTFQQKLLGKKVEFHGTEVVIGELLNDLSSIKSIPFNDLLDDKTIGIGTTFEFETEKLVERKFLPCDFKFKPLNIEAWESFRNYTIEHDLDELLTVTKGHKTILISDEPGMGKSTSFKMLHSNLRQKNPTLWLVFMDLKDHFKAYQASCLEVRKREDIAKFFTEKVLRIESFEAEIFTQLLNEDRVVLLMDGLDEICPSYKRFIFSLMKDIQKFSKNQLWISTRPHLVSELINELNPIEFKLKPFTEANRREFFEKHFIGDPNFDLILKEIESFLKKLRDDVCNPLVMRIIVEILDEDESLKLSEANLFAVYDRFTIKMIEKCQDKGSEARKDIANSFGSIVEFYQQQAFLTCFENQDFFTYFVTHNYALMRKILIDPQFEHVEKPYMNEIVRIGLMFANSSGEVHFIHRTFAEFYVAKFFYEVIFKFKNLRAEKHLNATIEFLLKLVITNFNFNLIRIFLDSAIDSHTKLIVRKFPPSTLTVVQQIMERKHFEHLVRNGYCNLIELFVLYLHPDCQELLFSREIETKIEYPDIFEQYCDASLVMVAIAHQSVDFVMRFFVLLKDLNTDELKKVLIEGKIKNRNALFVAALNPYSGVFKYIFDFCESFMTSEKLNELLMQSYEEQDYAFGKTNILHGAIEYDRHLDIVIKVLMLKLNSAQLKTMLETTHRHGNNSLQYAVENQKSVANFECLLAFIRQLLDPQDIENFLLNENDDGLKAFDIGLLNSSELIFDTMRKFYLEVLGEDKMRESIFDRNKCENWFQESSLYFRRMYQSDMFGESSYFDGAFKRFISFIMELFAAERIQKEFFLIKNDKDETFLEFAMKKLKEDDFTFFCSLLNTNARAEILQQRNAQGECAFHLAAKFNNSERFRKICQLYEENFNKETFRQMIVSCDKSWISDAVECVSRFENSETFSELCHYLNELFKGSDDTEGLKPFFLFADETGQTAFMAAARGKYKEFEHLFALTKELYDIEAVKEFLLLKDTNGATTFSHSFESGEVKNLEFVKSIFEELFRREKLQDLVMAKVRNENIMCFSMMRMKVRPDLFEILCDFLIKLFEGEPQKPKYLFILVDLDKTVLMTAAEESRYNYFKVLVNVIERLFVEEEIVEMLCQRNLEGKTAFHFAIGNYGVEIFETVKNFYFKTLGNEAMKDIISAKVDWTSGIDEYNLRFNVQRLVHVLKDLFEKVPFKNIFFKLYPKKTIRELMKRRSKKSNASLISYLKEQFQDDEQMKKFIIELESPFKTSNT